MRKIYQNPPPKFPSGSLLGIGIAVAAIGLFSTGQHLLDQWRYNKAMQAYSAADCSAAIDQLNPIINAFRLFDRSNYVPRAQEKKAECEYFQAAVDQQQQGKAEAALLDYLTLAKAYENSVLLDPARQQITELFQTAQTDALATSKVCDQLESLRTKDLIPELDSKVSQFYLTCGKTYETDKDYGRAIALYEQLLKQNPDQTQTQKLSAALARAMVANTRYQGATELAPPSHVTFTADGTTVVAIQNSSPRKMRITFSGPTPKFEEIEPCQDCEIYMREGPEQCPGTGPKQRYTLAPGKYNIAVNLAEIPGEAIESWVADWQLDEGTESRNCFVIVHGLEKDNKKDADDRRSQENPG